MNSLSYHESAKRGTPDFPLEPYYVDSLHPRYNMQMHWHGEYELICVEQGKLYMKLNNIAVNLSQGECVFIPGGIIHGATGENCRYKVIVFSPSILHATGKSKILIEQHLISPAVFKSCACTEAVFSLLNEKPLAFELGVTGELCKLMQMLIQTNPRTVFAADGRIEKIKASLTYIEQNYSESIRLCDIAKASSMNPNYFCRFFKSLTQQTVMEYITRFRIEKACEMLIAGISITDTAYACGFNDTSYFINVFKRHMGITPKQYRISQAVAD